MPRPTLFLALAALALLSPSPSRGAVDPSLLAGLKARSIGPAGMSGRIASVTGCDADPHVLYVGAATGGVWKSTDAGQTWTPIFDDQPVHSIGSVAVFPGNPDLVWVGTGEANLRNSVSIGNGVYRSRDGGKTWTYLGLENSERIADIVLDPRDPETAWAAVTGKMWGDSTERGVYKTVDGGKTWQRLLYVDERTGCADLAVDPSNPDRLLAAMYSFRRTPWSYTSGGWGSGLYLTLDGGRTWKRLTQEDGLPEGKLGRIALAFAPSDPRIAYALVEAAKNEFLRSDDGGATWKATGAKRGFGDRPFYFADIHVDPELPNRVYSMSSFASVSDDAGKTWKTWIGWSALHPDHHTLWIDPHDPLHLVDGNDGGVGVSYDRGASWRFVGNLPLAQYYHIRTDNDVPYHVYGGLQDNGSWRGPSAVWTSGGIRNMDWQEVGFGDGFDTSPYPKDSMEGYAMSQEGYLVRWNLRTGERRDIRPAPDPGDTLRFNWNAGFAQDPFDDDTIYLGSQYLHRSTDRGETWSRISPDLTTDNPAWQQQRESGGLTPDVTGAENYTTIVTVAPSPVAKGTIWVGTDDGRIQLTRDGGGTWTSVEKNVRGVPANTWVPHITPSPHDAAVAFAVFDDHRRSNPTPYLMETTDYGRHWRSLVTPDVRGYCLTLAQDPKDPNLLFLGTEFGLYVSLNGGGKWMPWTHGVPTSSVMALAIQPREADLVIGTHGRSAYILDDIRPLRELNDAVMAEPLHLFEIPPAQQYVVRQEDGSRFPGATEYRGENRPYGALITFSLNDADLPHPDPKVERERQIAKREKEEQEAGTSAPDTTVAAKGKESESPKMTIEIRDAVGSLVRTLKVPVTQGVNRAVWDLTADAFRRPPSGREEGDFDFGGGGPEVLPGVYRATLRWKGHEASGAVTVLADPRTPISPDDRRAAWDATQRAGRIQETVADAVQRIRDAEADVDFVLARIERLDRDRKAQERKNGQTEPDSTAAGPYAPLRKEANQVKKGLASLEGRLHQPRDAKGIPGDIYVMNDVSLAREFVGSTWDRPSPTVLAYLDRAERGLAAFLEEYNRFFDGKVAALRDSVARSGISILERPEPLTLPPSKP